MSKTPAQRQKKHGDRAVVPQAVQPAVIRPQADRDASSPESNGKMLVIAAVVAALFMFWYLHILVLNQMTGLSGGRAMPDSLVFGFGPEQINALRTAMDEAARGQLNWIHKTAGVLFPVIFAIAWLALIGLKVTRRKLRWVLWIPPVLFAVVRIVGNIAIDGLFGKDAPGDAAITFASGLVVTGWVLFILSLVAAVISLTPLVKATRPAVEG